MHAACCTLQTPSFFNLNKLLVLLSSAVPTQEKKTIILALGFSHPVTSEHSKNRGTEREDEGKHRRPRLAALCAASPGLPRSSRPVRPYKAVLPALSWLCLRSCLTQRHTSDPNKK